MRFFASIANRIKAEREANEVLEHTLNVYFPELLKFNSTAELEASNLYEKIWPEVERILNAIIVSEPSAVADGLTLPKINPEIQNGGFPPPATTDGSDQVRALAWNIERGSRFEGIVDALQHHPKLKNRDLLLLTELDYG